MCQTIYSEIWKIFKKTLLKKNKWYPKRLPRKGLKNSNFPRWLPNKALKEIQERFLKLDPKKSFPL